MGLFDFRPNKDEWKPVANAYPPDDTACWQSAADKLGVTIKIAYPVACHAGAGLAKQMGMKGIYVLRTQSEREHPLLDEYWRQKHELNK